MKRIALFGGSFNPPGLHHRSIVEALLCQFDEVIIVPCGPRPDKGSVTSTDSHHRAAMVDIMFRNLPVRIELFDLENATFTRTHVLDEMFRHEGELWHVVGTDLVNGGSIGQSFIQKTWQHGDRIWHELRFAVCERGGYPLNTKDLPPRHIIFTFKGNNSASSSAIRERAFKREQISNLVGTAIGEYIERHGLYTGVLPRVVPSIILQKPRLLIEYDTWNEDAKRIAYQLGVWNDEHDPNLVVSLGGDGTMLHTIQKHWRKRVPFFGINTGNSGFILNHVKDIFSSDLLQSEMIIRTSPLLYVEVETINGETKTGLAFNDVWVQSGTGKAAWIEVSVDGQVRLERCVGDGILLATAAGSTAYARAIGAMPLPVGTPILTLVGSNLLEPHNWKSAHLPLHSEVQLRNVDPTPIPKKRPIYGFIDGVAQGEVTRLFTRSSRIANVELAFLPDHDLVERFARSQFPQ